MTPMLRVAEELALSQEEVMREALRALLRDKIRDFGAERKARCAKFGVSSLQQLDDLMRAGTVEEDTILDDFQNVDYLTNRIKRLQQLLDSILSSKN